MLSTRNRPGDLVERLGILVDVLGRDTLVVSAGKSWVETSQSDCRQEQGAGAVGTRGFKGRENGNQAGLARNRKGTRKRERPGQSNSGGRQQVQYEYMACTFLGLVAVLVLGPGRQVLAALTAHRLQTGTLRPACSPRMYSIQCRDAAATKQGHSARTFS